MDQDYDVIVLGTGLKESILSGLMSSVCKKKVLHLDRNAYYGGETASLNLEQLWARFAPEEKEIPEKLGQSKDYMVDLCPKFIMACGNLVKILVKTNVTNYLEFRSVAGSYVTQGQKPKKVPSSAKEALSTPLLSMMQRVRFRTFLTFVAAFDEDDKKTYGKIDPPKMTSKQLYEYYKLGDKSQLFIGHAICLYLDDAYLDGAATDLIKRAQLYAYSVSRYGNSPYIYPKWGLSGLPEGFSRRSAVYGGVYMLNHENRENFIEKIHYDDKGMVTGVQVKGEVAKCEMVIGDPSYWIGTDKIEKKGTVARSINIMNHPIPETDDSDSCQIIIPGPDVKERKSDMYICMSSYKHNIAAEGYYVAVCSARSETDDIKTELEPALKLLGKVEKQFMWSSDYYEPKNDPTKDGCYITTSYDATTHFETCTAEVLDIFQKITGEALDLDTPESDGTGETEET